MTQPNKSESMIQLPGRPPMPMSDILARIARLDQAAKLEEQVEKLEMDNRRLLSENKIQLQQREQDTQSIVHLELQLKESMNKQAKLSETLETSGCVTREDIQPTLSQVAVLPELEEKGRVVSEDIQPIA